MPSLDRNTVFDYQTKHCFRSASDLLPYFGQHLCAGNIKLWWNWSEFNYYRFTYQLYLMWTRTVTTYTICAWMWASWTKCWRQQLPSVSETWYVEWALARSSASVVTSRLKLWSNISAKSCQTRVSTSRQWSSPMWSFQMMCQTPSKRRPFSSSRTLSSARSNLTSSVSRMMPRPLNISSNNVSKRDNTKQRMPN